MTNPTTRVKTLTRADEDGALAVIVAAFAADPVSRWFFPEDHTYRTCLPRFASAFAGGSFDHGMAIGTESGDGVALWMPPGVHPDEEAMGAVVAEGLSRAPHFEEVVAFNAQQSSIHPTFEHMYLPFLAVDPAAQGKGAGSALLAYSVAICDERGLPAYLEATSMRSRALYERHGFEVTGEIQFGTSPAMTAMLRQPRPLAREPR